MFGSTPCQGNPWLIEEKDNPWKIGERLLEESRSGSWITTKPADTDLQRELGGPAFIRKALGLDEG
jgi:hypothetical protein